MKGIFSYFRKKDPYPDGIDGFDWDESQPKWPAVRILNVSLSVISIIVWIILLFRLFAFGSGNFDKMILLDEKAQEFYPEKTNQVLRIHSNTDEGKSGLVIHYPVYLEKSENLQFTAQINRRVLKPGDSKLGYTFVLQESDGEKSEFYTLSYSKVQKKFNYTLFRLCFNGIELDQNKVYTLLVYQGEEKSDGGTYSVKDASFSFTILNSDTYCNITTPDKNVFIKK